MPFVRSAPRFSTGRINGLLQKAELVAAAAADHVFARIVRGEFRDETDRHLVHLKTRCLAARIVVLGNLGITGVSALRAFELSGISVACSQDLSFRFAALIDRVIAMMKWI